MWNGNQQFNRVVRVVIGQKMLKFVIHEAMFSKTIHFACPDLQKIELLVAGNQTNLHPTT